MGLLQALFDEVISLPGGIKDTDFEPDRVTSHRVPVGYALVNGFFQTLDCVVMPALVVLLWGSGFHGIVRWPLIILAAFSAGFSLFQALFYFLKPADRYVAFTDRLLGETAVGQVLAALLGLRIHYRI
jgi:hypothetical protein